MFGFILLDRIHHVLWFVLARSCLQVGLIETFHRSAVIGTQYLENLRLSPFKGRTAQKAACHMSEIGVFNVGSQLSSPDSANTLGHLESSFILQPNRKSFVLRLVNNHTPATLQLFKKWDAFRCLCCLRV